MTLKKSANRDCYCALCRTPRALQYDSNLSARHYGQIALITVILTWALFPVLEWKTLGSFFILWAGFEFTRKSLYRRDVKCSTCGFDPTWYRKDVRIARKHVENFLRDNPDSPLLRTRKTPSTSEISQ